LSSQDFAGQYDILVKTPLGDQHGRLAIAPDGDRFTGSLSGELGSQDIPDGTIQGDRLQWAMDVTKPMTLKLTCEAAVDGDALTGTVKAGIFGTFPMTGKRVV
jgi:hypothetical protein